MNIRTIIIDDEPAAVKNLANKVNQDDFEIVGIANNVNTGIALIEEHNPELVFLDIAMPRESGFDLLNYFDVINFEVIFVTAFDQYAIKAIEFCALGYILKPIEQEKLDLALSNAKRRIESEDRQGYKALKENLAKPNSQLNQISIKSAMGAEFIHLNDIVRMEADGKYTLFYLNSDRKLISSLNIAHYEKLLEDHLFFRTHKSHLINIICVDKYDKEGNIHMKNNSIVPLSRRKKNEFKNLLEKGIF